MGLLAANADGNEPPSCGLPETSLSAIISMSKPITFDELNATIVQSFQKSAGSKLFRE